MDVTHSPSVRVEAWRRVTSAPPPPEEESDLDHQLLDRRVSREIRNRINFPEVTAREVCKCIKTTKRGKAAGKDGFTVEFLKVLGHVSASEFVFILKSIDCNYVEGLCSF